MIYSIVGTGGIGGYYGAMLAKAGREVHFLMRSDYEYVKANGLIVKTSGYDIHLSPERIHVYNDSSKMPKSDVILVCLKTIHNDRLPQILPPLLKDDSIVVLIQNGLGMEEELHKALPDVLIAGATAFICTTKTAPGIISHTAYGALSIAPFSEGIERRLEKVRDDMEFSEIPCLMEKSLSTMRWKKLVWNIPFNGLSVVKDCNTSILAANPETRALVVSIQAEVVAAASACGVRLEKDCAQKMIQLTESMPPYSPSMYVDFASKRPMELRTMYLNPIEEASRHNVDMKLTRRLLGELMAADYSGMKDEMASELKDNILPYWMEKMTDPSGGFYGRRDGSNCIVADSPKGAILNARILWTFSSAYRIAGKCAGMFTEIQKYKYLETAERAYGELTGKFIDKNNGGLFWSIDPAGRPLDTKKQFYAEAFAIYAFSEYFRATSNPEALQNAIELYNIIERHSRDLPGQGYLEACTADWESIADMRLSDKDRNDEKTMNTHLHILEGYTGLYRVWKDKGLHDALRNLVELFADKFTGPDGHLKLFFDRKWHLTSTLLSFGHDIETSWLLCEAVNVLGDVDLAKRIEPLSTAIATASMEGFNSNDGMIYEWDPSQGSFDRDRHWWVQAETVVGCFNQWQLRGDTQWLDKCLSEWFFIKNNIIAPDGEWYWALKADGTHDTVNDRAGFWKCPYHNGRMCMEIIERICRSISD